MQNRADPAPADPGILLVPGPVDDLGLAQDVLHIHETPEPAVVAFIPVVTHNEDGTFGNLDRSEIVPGLNRARDDGIVRMHPVSVAPGETVQEDLLVPDFYGVAGKADEPLD